MPDVHEQIRWVVQPKGAKVMDTHVEGLGGIVASVFAVLIGAILLVSLIIALRGWEVRDTPMIMIPLVIALVLLCGGAYVFVDRVWLQPRAWRGWLARDQVSCAWAAWRAAESRAWGTDVALRALNQACRSSDPPIITIAPELHMSELSPQVGLPLLEPEPVTGRVIRRVVWIGGLVLATFSLAFADTLANRVAGIAPCGLFFLIAALCIYLSRTPVRLAVGSGTVEHRGRRWTVDDSVMLVTRAPWTALRVRIVGPEHTLVCNFRSVENKHFLALWQRWNTASPKTDLPAITT